MKSRSILALSLVLLAAPVFSLPAAAQGRASDRVLDKIGKTDILFNILPVLLTKKQILDLLPVLERARENVRKQMDKEDAFLKDVESIADAAYQKAIEKNLLPSEEERSKLGKALLAYRLGREKVAADNVDLVQPAFDRIVNAGQRKTAANSLNVRAFLPEAKPEQMSDSEKERLFIRFILLDSATYDMLTDMAKARKD